MKKTTLFLTLLLTALWVGAQPFAGQYTPQGEIHITDQQPPALPPGFDSVFVEYTAQAPGCASWTSGRLAPATSFTLPCPPDLLDGCSLKKYTWLGKFRPNGSFRWQSQTGGCTALVFPATSQPAQPFVLNVQGSVYSPNWLTPEVQGNSVQPKPTPDQPPGIEIETFVAVTQSGLVADPQNLPPGLYYAYCVIVWQGMTFLETDTFFIQ